jgi:nicotinate-nucleotide adenylyltransferase
LIQKIGVFGGSFNPIHHGHLILAQDVLESFELDHFLFVPCGFPPHKDLADYAPGDHRLNMLEMVAETDPRFEVTGMELERDSTSYTYESLKALQDESPDEEILFVIGSDTLPELHTWHCVEDLLDEFRIVSLVRPGFRFEDLESLDFRLRPGRKEELLGSLIQGHRIDVSSSDIRMRLAEGMSIRYLVPEEVEMYIYEHGLYKC